jgi:FkbM family methyltransferase
MKYSTEGTAPGFMSSGFIKSVMRATVPRPVRNWLRSPSKSAAWLWDSFTFSLGATKTLGLLPDWSIVCHPHAYKVFYEAQILDHEQAEEFRNFLSHCSCKMFLFDVGAHFGVFSLAAAHFGGRSIALDPSPTATRMIAIEAALNNCTPDIHVMQAAASDTSGAMGMLSSGVFSDGYFQVAKWRSSSDLSRTQAITVDDLTLQHRPPTHLKIDVEGHEAAVLRGARTTLSQFSPLLFLELHNEIVTRDGGDPNSALDELAQLDYATFALDGDPVGRASLLSKPIVRIVAARNRA